MQAVMNGLETLSPAPHLYPGPSFDPGRERCSAPGCMRSAQVWVSGEGACGRAHLALLLRAGLAAERARNAKARLRLYPALPVGQLLLRAGSVTEAALADALRAQERAGAGRLGAWLRQQCGLDELALAAALAAQQGCPVLSLAEWRPESSLAPAAFFEQYGGIPLCGEGISGRIAVAFEDEGNPEMLRALARIHGRPVVQGLLPATVFWDTARTWLALRQPPMPATEVVPLDVCAESFSSVLHETDARTASFATLGDRVWLRYTPHGSRCEQNLVYSVIPDKAAPCIHTERAVLAQIA